MDVQRQIERDRTEAFYALLVERLGEDVWAERKAAYVERVRAKESQFNIRLPVEPQLFVPTEDDIDWYHAPLGRLPRHPPRSRSRRSLSW